MRHLGDTAGVVGHGTVGVDADGDGRDRQHAERGKTDAVDARGRPAHGTARLPIV